MIVSLNMSKAQGVSFGIKAGVNLQNITGLNMSSNVGGVQQNGTSTMNIGFHVGGIMKLGFSENWALIPEFLYTTSGVKQTITQTYAIGGVNYNSSSVNTTSLGYIQIPVLLNYRIPGGLNFSAGPYLSMLVGSNSSTSTTINGETTTHTSSSDTSNSKVDIGLALGVGFQTGIGLGIGLRYDIGMTSVYKTYTYNNSGMYYTQPASGKNGVLQLSLNFMF